eukprot:1511974-Prymnesium_polylepis.1
MRARRCVPRQSERHHRARREQDRDQKVSGPRHDELGYRKEAAAPKGTLEGLHLVIAGVLDVPSLKCGHECHDQHQCPVVREDEREPNEPGERLTSPICTGTAPQLSVLAADELGLHEPVDDRLRQEGLDVMLDCELDHSEWL